ncbi:hypothetical protein [Dictyobacter aurantiacus]|uniref:Uncharacterized protein n=1 Tax=Dictyobacter aurantiacus TaxID=1936993 RepID=A0A401ZC93_9CHLR|nr:hypothetical protein [Dictyobacter aurantiacus]GCE04446.1 hypothetical protein KDAU_17750 [Dictyobacter aurantiacus]
MNLGPSNPNYPPGMSGQHDAPTEMFQTNPPPPGAPYRPGAGAPFNPGQRPGPTVRPEQLINKKKAQTLPPGPWHTKLAYLWRSDPAYKVLFIAIGVVIVCSIVGVILVGTAFSSFTSRSATNPNQNGSQTVANTPQATPTTTPTAQPTMTPTPQPTATPTAQPTVAPTPTAQPTIASTPTPVPNNGPLTVQFTNLPAQAQNHSTVPVTVATKPGATVALLITYNASPSFQQTTTVTADANGTATIPWTINERAFSRFTQVIAARVVAIARDQNNQQTTSQPATVQILGN